MANLNNAIPRKYFASKAFYIIMFALFSFNSPGGAHRKAWKNVEALINREAILSCEVSSVKKEDTIYVVLFYRNGNEEPIYSYDNRPHSFQKGIERHILQYPALEGRVEFKIDPVPALHIRPVMKRDEANYTCRVDLRLANSYTTYVNLEVVVNPTPPSLRKDGKPFFDRVLGPIKEDESLEMGCVVTGGEPPPRVHWLWKNEIIDSTYEQISSSSSSSHFVTETTPVSTNNLSIKNLNRTFHESMLFCSVSNNNVTDPFVASVKIVMHLRPASVKIITPPRHFLNGKKYYLSCEVKGSRPLPNITWLLEKGSGEHYFDYMVQVEEKGNSSISTVIFQSSLLLQRMNLTCSAFNSIFPSTVLSDTIIINVTYPPIVSLQLGRGVSSIVREGEDVYFDCFVKSNPPSFKITWLHEFHLAEYAKHTEGKMNCS